jgi:HEAT repeat protein
MRDSAGALPGGAWGEHVPALRPRRFAAAFFAALALAAPARAPGIEAPAPRLRALLTAARLVVAGEVAGVASYDDDRVAVLTFTVARTLKAPSPAAAPKDVAIVELHEGPVRPPLATGTRGIAFLRPAVRTSYYAKTLPAGVTYYELVNDYGSFLGAPSQAELDREVEVVSQLVAVGRGEPLTGATARRLTFALLGAQNPVLVEDAAAGLEGFGTQRELSADELSTMRAALTRDDLSERIRIALIDAIASGGVTDAVPVLQQIDHPTAVAEAAWRALDKLGAPVSEKSLDERLADRDPAVRAATVRELLKRDGTAAISRVAPVAVQDPDPTVRIAAVDALGALATPEAVPPLERVFGDSSGELQRAAGRAILGSGSDAAADAFGRLAFVGSPSSQHYAVVLLMLIDDPHAQAVLQRVKATHTDPEIQNLIEHGFPTHEH